MTLAKDLPRIINPVIENAIILDYKEIAFTSLKRRK